MKVYHGLFALGFVQCTLAQYFSEGWKPEQAVSKAQSGYTTATASSESTIAAAYNPRESPAPKSVVKGIASFFDLSNLLETGPARALFGSLGVNISEKIEAAKEQAKIWDERIPLITDDNYEEVVINEKFGTLEEEKDRLWFIVITVSSAQREGISRYVDDQFDTAFKLTQEEGDLQHVRWGRIDYMNVTAITTKWNVWRAPFLVVAKDRGQTLRFYRPGQLRMQGEVLREFLRQDAWLQSEPWRSAFGPGGSREFVADYLASTLTKVYNYSMMVPRWVLLLVTGSLASFIVNLLHNSRLFSSPAPSSKPKSQKPNSSPANKDTVKEGSQPQAVASGAGVSKGSTNKRKSGKK